MLIDWGLICLGVTGYNYNFFFNYFRNEILPRWDRIRLKIIFSIILEMKFMLETGLLFFMLCLDSDGFFNKDAMCDIR